MQSCRIFGDAENKIIREECDYEGVSKATLFLVNGNATTDNSIHLSVGSCWDDKLKDRQIGNIFVADSDHGKVILDSTSVTFKWKSYDTLKVIYDRRLRIFNQQTKTKDAVIVYQNK